MDVALPIRTTVEDIQVVCGYLARKPTGATLKESKAVLDSKILDSRRLSAFKFWELIEDQARLKLAPRGREVVQDHGAQQAVVFGKIIRDIDP